MEDQFKEIDPTGAKREAYRRAWGRESAGPLELQSWLWGFGGPEPDHATPEAMVEDSPAISPTTSASDQFAACEERKAVIVAAIAAITSVKNQEELAKAIQVDPADLSKWKKLGRSAFTKKGSSSTKKADRIEDFLRPYRLAL